jgi:hypothetical protein
MADPAPGGRSIEASGAYAGAADADDSLFFERVPDTVETTRGLVRARTGTSRSVTVRRMSRRSG